MPSAHPVTELRDAISRASTALGEGHAPVSPTLERPPKAELGEYSTNAAMLLAPVLGEAPGAIAERLADQIGTELGSLVGRTEVAGPGFVNLFLSDAWYREAAATLAGDGEDLGRSDSNAGSVLVEFVSANPTGPLTAAGGRHAAYGDGVARALEWSGGEVQREYYVNDAGGQIERFAASIAARMRGEVPPEDGYAGDYVSELAEQLREEGLGPDDFDALAVRGAEAMRASAEQTLRRYGVEFDTWFSERSIAEDDSLEGLVEELRAGGEVYESEGATWLRTTSFGDDKDRVLLRSGGEPTYFLTDIAYHRDKLERSGGALLDVLGADHHGYTARLRAGLAALGLDPELLEFSIVQLVHIVDAGERAQMSKRRGEFVTLDELLDDIGVDAARFFMLQRSHDTTVDLDLTLARKESADNPVYYVQYAHARIASILRKAGDEAVDVALADGDPVPTPLDPAERALTRRLLELTEEVVEAAARRAPHRLCAYASATAADFHAFYRDCQVVGAEGAGVEGERLRLCMLSKRSIARTLALLGIDAPEQM